jgi:hypothetical protein
MTVAYLKVLTGQLAEETTSILLQSLIRPNTGYNIVTLAVNGMYSILLVSSIIT